MKLIFSMPPLTGPPAGAVVVGAEVVLGAETAEVVGAAVEAGGLAPVEGAVEVGAGAGLVQAVTRVVTMSRITKVIPKSFPSLLPVIFFLLES